MDYRELMTAPGARLSPWEALAARVQEVASAWNGFDHAERDTIRHAMRLDLASLGFTA